MWPKGGKIAKACRAMKEFGIAEVQTKAALKQLLEVYENNWDFIEADDYKELFNFIVPDNKKPNEERVQPKVKGALMRESKRVNSKNKLAPSYDTTEVIERPTKRYCTRQQKNQPLSRTKYSESSLRRTPPECMHIKFDEESEESEEWQPLVRKPRQRHTNPQEIWVADNKVGPVPDDCPELDISPNLICEGNFSDSDGCDVGEDVMKYLQLKSKNKQPPSYDTPEVIEWQTKRFCTRQQKNQPSSLTKYSESSLRKTPGKMHVKFDEESEDSQPLVRKPRQRHINPQEVWVTRNNIDHVLDDCPELEIGPSLVCECNFTNSDGCDVGEDVVKYLPVELLNESNSVSVSDGSQTDVASSSPLKNPLLSSSSQKSGFDLPNGEVSQEMMEEKCIISYRTGECCSMAIVTNVTENMPEFITSNEQDQGSKCSGLGSFNELFVDQNLIEPIRMPNYRALGSFEGLRSLIGIKVKDMENICGESAKRSRVSKGQKTSQLCKVEAGHNYHSSLRVTESAFNIDDITRGEERFKISLENGRNAELPTFSYIAQNLIYNKASVTFALANISDEDCCSKCYGDCLTSSIPCLCVIANGGECAYTPGGLVKEKFLEECISMKREPEKHPYFYCKKCPLVRLENAKSSVACKGHLLRRFIKECWYKCGCNRSCGNRIVQKGIAVKLQVFLTPEGKGWGLRTLEALPRGAFVCEYVGEIVTIDELHERSVLSIGKEHTYPVLLDADWGSQDVLKDEKALCLDTTVYGNVARFINHRCSDATLVEIPVEVETPDRHYYHVALFTTRDVGAMEELTWDYGISFHDRNYPVKHFRCLCGSPLCRDRKDIKRKITYVRRRRKDGRGNNKDGLLDHLAKDLATGTLREEIQVEPDSLMQLDVVPSTGALREEIQVAPHESRLLEIVPSTGAPKVEIQVAPDPCMQLQVIPSTPRIESRKAMHCLNWEPVRDSCSSSSTMYLAKEVADLRAQLEAEKAAREKDQINFEAHRAQFQAVMQQLSTLLPGFQVPQASVQMQLE
ncbi:probable inactive histone-lysine N-methyltransferase SUVR1 [Rosa rugosa]|uniref:probable inactive histone-lysine N-methyltransferase SUVR1 n=1 Tax=Rosa rugosa TaxID=74645 RepID=UPI002B40BC3B|nr:probable inactive histone-lysine N-methyltransferase SUVR1 [Rosa rugosa]